MPYSVRVFLKEMRRRKVYRVGAVYAVVGFVVAQVAEISFPAFGIPDFGLTLVLGMLVLGFPVALVLAWAFELRPEEPPPPPGDADRSSVDRGGRAIAVLPFDSLSSDPEGDYFADGITEELTNALARQRGLRVAARTSAFAFKGQRTDVREIGRTLGVTHVIEGSVRRSERALRITAQLIETEAGYHVWSQQYDREIGDVFRIQEEIAASVVQGLMGAEAGASGPSIAHAELSAYDAYLMGRHGLASFRPEAIREAITHFETAIMRDGSFAPAMAGLAEALTVQAIGFGDRPTRETMPRAEEAAARALRLDEHLPDAHVAQALVRMYWRWDYAGARASFARALELNPNHVEAHLWMEFYWTYVVRDFQKAVDANATARRLSPLDRRIPSRLGTILYIFGELGQAEEIFRGLLAEDPDDALAHLGLADTLVRQGRVDEAIPHAEAAVRSAGRPDALLGVLGAFYGLRGDMGSAEEILSELKARGPTGSAFWCAVVYAGIQRHDEAFVALEQAIDDKDSNLLYLTAVPPELHLLDDPRCQHILARMHLEPTRLVS